VLYIRSCSKIFLKKFIPIFYVHVSCYMFLLIRWWCRFESYTTIQIFSFAETISSSTALISYIFRNPTISLDGRLVWALYALFLRFLTSPKPTTQNMDRVLKRRALRPIQKNWKSSLPMAIHVRTCVLCLDEWIVRKWEKTRLWRLTGAWKHILTIYADENREWRTAQLALGWVGGLLQFSSIRTGIQPRRRDG